MRKFVFGTKSELQAAQKDRDEKIKKYSSRRSAQRQGRKHECCIPHFASLIIVILASICFPEMASYSPTINLPAKGK
jgi:hypothetical protein